MLRLRRIRSAAWPRFGAISGSTRSREWMRQMRTSLMSMLLEAARRILCSISESSPVVSTPEKPPPAMTKVSKRLLLGRVVLDVGEFEAAEDVVAEPEGVAEVLHGERVLGDAGHRRGVADLAEAEDEVVVRHLDQLAALALGDLDDLPLDVDAVDLAPAELGLRHDVADRVDDVGRVDAAGRHLGQERLEDEVVLLGEELDVHVAGARPSRRVRYLAV